MENVDLAVKNLKKEFKLKGAPGLRQIKTIISKMGYTLLTYENSEDLLEELDLIEDAKHHPSISCSIDDKNYTFYRGTVHSNDLPFILCHEMGHIYMNHVNHMDSYRDTSSHKEEEANIFAARLLYPQKKKKSKLSVFLALALLLYSTFTFFFLDVGAFGIFKYTSKSAPKQETVQSASEQPPQTEKETSKDSEFLDTLIIKVENAVASPKIEQPAQLIPLLEEQPALQPAKVQETSVDVLDTTEQVVVTRTGRKYHKPDCSYVKYKTDTTTYTLAEAESNYYAPCSRCF